MRKGIVNVVLVIAIAVLFAVALVIGNRQAGEEEAFGGTDSQATEVIESSNPDYKPWFEPLFAPAGEVESGLFALQAGIGGGILGFGLGAFWYRRHMNRSTVDTNTTSST